MCGTSVRFAANTPEDAAELPPRLFRSLLTPERAGPRTPGRHPGDRPVSAGLLEGRPLIGCDNIRLARVQPTWKLREPKGGGQAIVYSTGATARLHGTRARARPVSVFEFICSPRPTNISEKSK